MTAANRFNIPAPPCDTLAAAPKATVAGVAPLINSERYCCIVSPGRAALRTAAAPAASGEEKLVPAVSLHEETKPGALIVADAVARFHLEPPLKHAVKTVLHGLHVLP